MCQLCFRLVTALLTFAAGLAASALWGATRTPAPPPPPRPAAVMVAAPAPRVEAPPAYGDAGIKIKGDGARILSGGVLNGKAVSKPAPVYPAAARAARAQGQVVVHIVVGVDGRIETARAVSGHELLRQAAAEAVSQWRFPPTLLSGQPVRVSGAVVVNFTLP